MGNFKMKTSFSISNKFSRFGLLVIVALTLIQSFKASDLFELLSPKTTSFVDMIVAPGIYLLFGYVACYQYKVKYGLMLKLSLIIFLIDFFLIRLIQKILMAQQKVSVVLADALSTFSSLDGFLLTFFLANVLVALILVSTGYGVAKGIAKLRHRS